MAMCDDSILVFTEGQEGDNDTKTMEDNTWYLDNGASNHMTRRREKFENLDRSIKGEVKFGDGSLVKIEGKGSIRIACKNGKTRICKACTLSPHYGVTSSVLANYPRRATG